MTRMCSGEDGEGNARPGGEAKLLVDVRFDGWLGHVATRNYLAHTTSDDNSRAG